MSLVETLSELRVEVPIQICGTDLSRKLFRYVLPEESCRIQKVMENSDVRLECGRRHSNRSAERFSRFTC